MSDNSRKYPVTLGIMHHSTGPDMYNWEDVEVQDWYSSIGKTRGYTVNGKVLNPMHEHPNRAGQSTYAQAQACLRRYDTDGNRYGWRLTILMRDPWNNVAWGAGNWAINQVAWNTEVSGNYLNQKLPDKALMLMADSFRDHDRKLVSQGVKSGWIWAPHKTYKATQCPGLITEQIPTLVDMTNHPEKYQYLFGQVIQQQQQVNQEEFLNQLRQKDGVIQQKDQTIISLEALKRSVEEQNTILSTQVTDLNSNIIKRDQANQSDISNLRGEYDGKITTLTNQVTELSTQVQLLLIASVEQTKLIESKDKLIVERDLKIQELEIKFSVFNNAPSKAVEKAAINSKVIDVKELPHKFIGLMKNFAYNGKFRTMKTFMTHFDAEIFGILWLQILTYIPLALDQAYNIALPSVPVAFSQAFTAAYLSIKVPMNVVVASKKAKATRNAEYVATKLATGDFLKVMLSGQSAPIVK